DASPLSQLTLEVVQSAFHVFEVRPARPKLFGSYEGFWTDRAFRAPNPPMGARITYWIREYTGDEVAVAIADGAGRPVRKLTGRAGAQARGVGPAARGADAPAESGPGGGRQGIRAAGRVPRDVDVRQAQRDENGAGRTGRVGAEAMTSLPRKNGD